METFSHQFTELFQQLGLASDPANIALFIARNAPLAADIRLADAPFWTPSQARFLCEAVHHDAAWVAAVDGLDIALRRPT